MKILALVAIDPDFWRRRRVLVTGHTGFKGAWLSLWLQSLGAEVTGLAPGVPTRPSLCSMSTCATARRHAPRSLLARDGAGNPPEADHLALDSSAAERALDWSPRWPLSQTLELVVE